MFREQYELFYNYMRAHEPNMMPAEKYLQDWKIAKEGVITDVLGKGLYYEQPINIEEPEESLTRRIDNLITSCSMYFEMRSALIDYGKTHESFDDIDIFDSLFSYEAIADNRTKCDIELEGLKIKEGTKLMRAFGKLVKYFNIPESYYEEFRKRHGQLISQRSISGTLCISALPMDYVTMSDNFSNWSSCYSITRGGTYSPATLSLLNSKNVIVAYIKNDKRFTWDTGRSWNNKMWRELFYIDQDFILCGKGYPYESEIIENIVLNILRSKHPCRDSFVGRIFKAREGNPGTFSCNGISISFRTENTYNDFYESVRGYAVNGIGGLFNLEYGGEVKCLVCGKPLEISDKIGHTEAANHYVCEDCRPFMFCSYCDEYIQNINLVDFTRDNEPIHPSCLEELEWIYQMEEEDI